MKGSLEHSSPHNSTVGVSKFVSGSQETYLLRITTSHGRTFYSIPAHKPDLVLALRNILIKAIDLGIRPQFNNCTFGEIESAAVARLIELAIQTYDEAVDADNLIDILSDLPLGRIS